MNGNGPTVSIKKISASAATPHYAHETDSAADLFSSESAVLFAGKTLGIKTGITLAFPPGYAGQVRAKSGLALAGIVVHGGVIDHSYRGEIIVILHNLSTETKRFNIGDKLGQLFLERVEQAYFQEVEVLPEAVTQQPRGTGGFGSTGI